jgi:hypothetical protein
MYIYLYIRIQNGYIYIYIFMMDNYVLYHNLIKERNKKKRQEYTQW